MLSEAPILSTDSKSLDLTTSNRTVVSVTDWIANGSNTDYTEEKFSIEIQKYQ